MYTYLLCHVKACYLEKYDSKYESQSYPVSHGRTYGVGYRIRGRALCPNFSEVRTPRHQSPMVLLSLSDIKWPFNPLIYGISAFIWDNDSLMPSAWVIGIPKQPVHNILEDMIFIRRKHRILSDIGLDGFSYPICVSSFCGIDNVRWAWIGGHNAEGSWPICVPGNL